MARRSARLSNRNCSTPKRVSLSHDEVKAPHTMPAKLPVVHEANEVPGAFPDSASRDSRAKQARLSMTETPSKTTPIRPSYQEMHPQYHQQSTAKPLDEARYLGFSNIGAYTAPPKQTSKIAMLQCTPSKSSGAEHEKKSPSFQFTFRREQSLELSPQAKKLMNEKREEAAKIRQQMLADGQGLETIDVMLERKIAIPKSQKGRYGEVHQAEFDKMDSIAGHASAFRTNLSRPTSRTSTPVTKPKQLSITPNPKSLKRSPSKAGLDEPETSPTRPTPHFAKRTVASSSTPQPHGVARRAGLRMDSSEHASATKRVRIAESGDVSTAKRQAIPRDEGLATTLAGTHAVEGPASGLVKKGLATPTQASIAGTTNPKSVQVSKIPGPASVATNFTGCVRPREPERSAEPESPLLSRSPVKYPHFDKPIDMKALVPSIPGPLLSRTPLKPPGTAKKPHASKNDDSELKSSPRRLLSLSPTKLVSPKKSDALDDRDQKIASSTVPLLTQSPVRKLFGKSNQTDSKTMRETKTLLFAKSPSKLYVSAVGVGALTPIKSRSDGQTKTPERPKLLQVSPVKSILRTPQRLFSEDPAKLAAGTHFAAPSQQESRKKLFAIAATPTTAQKRVDFTSSTKAGEDPPSRGLSAGPLSGTPSSSTIVRKPARAASSSVVEYPALPTDDMPPSPSPQKRRLTLGPQDFTFRAGDQDIIFGPSPNAPKSIDQTKKVSTIRYVPSEAPVAPTPVTGSKKRKFDFENTAAASADPNGDISDKENTPASATEESEDRPTKRSKLGSVMREPKIVARAQRPAVKVTTSGVKPKKDSSSLKKRPNTITQSRLNTLAQPKRRN